MNAASSIEIGKRERGSEAQVRPMPLCHAIASGCEAMLIREQGRGGRPAARGESLRTRTCQACRHDRVRTDPGHSRDLEGCCFLRATLEVWTCPAGVAHKDMHEASHTWREGECRAVIMRQRGGTAVPRRDAAEIREPRVPAASDQHLACDAESLIPTHLKRRQRTSWQKQWRHHPRPREPSVPMMPSGGQTCVRRQR